MAGLLDGKATIVTGAAGGIGRIAVAAFAREGARILATDIDEAGGEALVAEVRAAGAEAAFMPVDIVKEDQVEAMVRRAVELFGRLDCAYNNVGIGGGGGSVVDMKREDLERVLQVNVVGTWLCMKYEIPQLIAGGGGAIVNMASMSGVQGVPGASAYSASKHAVNGLTKTASAEFGRQEIRVNSVCPGVVNTPMMLEAAKQGMDFNKLNPTAFGRGADPAEVAELVMWLLSPRSSYITGQPINIDGGKSATAFFAPS